MSLPMLRFVPAPLRLSFLAKQQRTYNQNNIPFLKRDSTFLGTVLGRSFHPKGLLGSRTQFDRADLWPVWWWCCFVETGEKCKMRGEKKMTAYKGAINNSQKQGCPDTEKIGYAEEGPFISHIECCKRTVFYLFIFTIVL